MKRKLLLICIALLCTVGVWGYTSVTPGNNRAYFLYNVNKGTYWYGADHNIGSGSNTRYSGHTSSLSNATPTRVSISSNNYTFTYYVNGVAYQIRHSATKGDAVLTGGSADFQLYSKADGYSIEFKTDYQRRMRAEDAGTCDYPKDLDDDRVHWRFYAYEDILPTLVSNNASTCASTAASYVSGWERVTTKEQLAQNPEKYFYAIFSAVNPGVMMTTEYNDGAYRMCYKAAGNPLSSSIYDLFELENYNGEFAIKSNITGKYYGNASDAPWNFIANQETLNEACKVTVTCSNEVFNLQDKYADGNAATDPYVGNYLGAWDNMEFTGERLAGNKSLLRAGYFLIYRIAKKDLVMTDLIDNPDMETAGSGSGYGEYVKSWNNTGNVVNYRRLANSGVNNPDGAFTNTYCFENWTNASGGLTGQMSQTISSLPNGVYKLQLAALVRSVNGQFIYGKSNGNTYKTSLSGVNEKAYDYTVYVLVENNQLEIGLDMNNAGADWAAIDNARLTFLISSLPASLTGVSGKMNASVSDAQDAAIAAYNAVDGQTPSNYAAAIEAIANAEASIAAYAKAATYLSSVEAVLATTNFYTPAAYTSVYGTYKTAYDAGTLDDATADGLSYKVANYSGTERYDKNTANDLLIPGWTIDNVDAAANQTALYINTWSTEDNSNGFANPFYEYWVADNSVLGAKKIVGTLSGLTANKYYKVTAKVRVRETDSSTKVANSITMQVGSGDKVDVTAGTQISTTPRYVGQVSAIGQADGSGNLVLTFDVASGSNISWLSFRDVNYSDPTPEAKAVLLSTINDANTLYNSGANVGSGVFQIPTAAGTTFSNAITTAQGVYDNASSTYEEVLSANSTLQTAITTYEGVTLNAPTGGTRYKLTLADRGTLTYQTASTEGGYGMPFKAAGDYMAQTFTFTQVSGNTYTMSFEDFDGNTRYICTRAQYGEGGTGTYGIRSFVAGEDGKTALRITIQATTTANVFNMLNTECDNKKLGSNGGDFYTDNAYTSWSIAEATQAEVTVSCKAGKYGTVIFPFTPDVSEGFDGITFYSCEDINTTTNNVLIESVDEPQANTPYIIKNANGSNFSTILTGWGTSATTEHTVGLLTGVYTDAYIPRSDASNSYYVLQTKDDVQAFYKVEDADFPGTPYKCYLTIPAATPVKAFLFPENPTAINAIEAAENENTEIYSLAGQRLSKAQKGVNIINGKKVLVK